MENFFNDANYKIPSTSNYMKFQEGTNTFRVLSSAIVGYEYFNKENKPVRSQIPFDDTPDIKQRGETKHFWAFAVYNYNDKRIQILELTQKGIMKTMQSYIKNPKWGNPKEYDFVVERTGSGLTTEYAVSVEPKSPIAQEILEKYNNMSIDLTELYIGGDPFNKQPL